jgi:hypothetical protein
MPESSESQTARVELSDDAIFVHEIEAARILGGIAPRTLQRMRLEGRGPAFYKFGHAVRYNLAELIEYAKNQRRESTSDHGQAPEAA